MSTKYISMWNTPQNFCKYLKAMKCMPVKSHTVAGQLDDHIKTMGEGGEEQNLTELAFKVNRLTTRQIGLQFSWWYSVRFLVDLLIWNLDLGYSNPVSLGGTRNSDFKPSALLWEKMEGREASCLRCWDALIITQKGTGKCQGLCRMLATVD